MDEAPVRCERCERVEAQPPPTWSLESDGDSRTWLCESCTRANVRSIEAKLDDTWW